MSLEFWSICHLPMSHLGVYVLRIPNLVDELQLSQRIQCSSVFGESSIVLSSTLSKIGFLFLSRRQCILAELGMMTASVHTTVLGA